MQTDNQPILITGETGSGKEVLMRQIVDYIPFANPLLVIIGRTASGKDTLTKQLLTNERTMAITHTTRPRRPGEGDVHHFINNPDDYYNKVLETEVNGHHYFALDIDLYKHDIVIVDANGLRDLQRHVVLNRPYRVIYLDIDESTRRSRYMARANASEDDFIKRSRSEDEQFNRLEHLIKSDDYRDKYNITVIRSDDELTKLIETL